MDSMRRTLKFRTVFWALVAVVLVLLLALAFSPWPVPADVGEVTPGPLTVAVRDEGRTRVRDMYVVSTPVAGRLMRVGNRVGEKVAAGEIVAILQPGPPALVDERYRNELEAGVRAMQAGLALAEAELERAEAEQAQAMLEAERVETLFAAAVASQSALDRAHLDVRTAAAAVHNARAGVGVRRAELDAARARLSEPAPGGSGRRTVAIRAPAAGRVLRVLVESEAVVGQGTPVLEIGDPGRLEVVAELLSSDAARLSAGAPALIEAWGGPPITARVRQVEPYGFLDVSALGVEEQRVNVILEPTAPPAAWLKVGHGYRVEVAVTVWRSDQVVRLPVAALFRRDGRWAVFRVERGRASATPVEIGQTNGQMAEVLSGVRPGDRVVLHPGQFVSDGDRLRVRAVS